MTSRFRYALYAAGPVVLLCLTVSIRAQEAVDKPLDQTVETKQVERKTDLVTSPKDVQSDNEKELAVIANKGAAFTAPASFLPSRTLPPPGEHLAPPTAANTPQSSTREWRFMVAPYLWLAGISGTVGVGDTTTDIDPGASDILNALNFGFMATFEANRKRLTILTDLMYISLEKSRALNGPAFSNLQVNEKAFMLSPAAGYRLYEREGTSIDAIVGVRFWHMSSKLELAPGVLAGRVREQSK